MADDEDEKVLIECWVLKDGKWVREDERMAKTLLTSYADEIESEATIASERRHPIR